MGRRHLYCRDRVDLVFCIKSPFLNTTTDVHFHLWPFYICTNTKMLMLMASSIKLHKESGGASPCVCEQYQLSKASCKLPQYQLKEWKTVAFYGVSSHMDS